MAFHKTVGALVILFYAAAIAVPADSARSIADNDMYQAKHSNQDPMALPGALLDGDGPWCVASPDTPDPQLQANIVFVCKNVNCQLIQPGGPCYDPNTLYNHASWAMNSYFFNSGKHTWDCDFNGSGRIVPVDPSYGRCEYLS